MHAGKEYYEPHDLPPEAAVEAALAVLIALKLPRQTEGMLDSATFPANYFCLGQIDQWFGEQFEIEFARITGGWRQLVWPQTMLASHMSGCMVWRMRGVEG